MEMNLYPSIEAIDAALQQSNNVMGVSMEQLRDAHGAQRLGNQVRAGIANKLRNLGIAYHPTDLPSYEHIWVLLYKQGTPVENLVKAILQPGYQSTEVIGRAVEADAEATLQKIRELVCD